MLEPTEKRPPFDEETLGFFDAAVNGNDARLLNYLQRFGTACIDQQDSAGWTALMYAARNDNLSTIDILLLHGASTQVKSVDGHDVISIAWKCSSPKTLSYLLDWPAAQKRTSSQSKRPAVNHPLRSPEQIAESNIHVLKKMHKTSPITLKRKG